MARGLAHSGTSISKVRPEGGPVKKVPAAECGTASNAVSNYVKPMRPKLAFRLFAVTVLACLTVGTERLSACTCIQSGPACQETWRAGAVFVGRVAEIVP